MMYDPSDNVPDPAVRDAQDAPLDAANQSLADALRASFRILKSIMALLVVVYLMSGITFVQPNEQAVVARLGEIQNRIHDPGPFLAWPYPIDDVIRLPVKEASDLLIESHMLALSDEERSRGLSFVTRGEFGGLDPVKDGALLTADRGLVHVRWVATYKIDNLADYVRNLKGEGKEAAEALLKVLVENVAVHVASGLPAEDVYRRRVGYLRAEVMKAVNVKLRALESGVVLADLKVPVSIVPLQVRGTFEEAQKSENRRRRLIQEAEKTRAQILNDAAGSAFTALVSLLDDMDAARRVNDADRLASLQVRLDRMLDGKFISGEAGKNIEAARGRYATVVGSVENDVREYRTLIPEYERNGPLLLARKWDETRNVILNNPKVTKVYRPFNVHQVRIIIGPDPEQKRLAERRKYEEEAKTPLQPGVHEVPVIIP